MYIRTNSGKNVRVKPFGREFDVEIPHNGMIDLYSFSHFDDALQFAEANQPEQLRK